MRPKEPDPIEGTRPSWLVWLVVSVDGPAKRVMPPAPVDNATGRVGKLGFDPLLIFDGLLLVLERAVKEALLRCPSDGMIRHR